MSWLLIAFVALVALVWLSAWLMGEPEEEADETQTPGTAMSARRIVDLLSVQYRLRIAEREVAQLRERVAALEQSRRDLRAGARAAYEPEPVAGCSKLRYVRYEDAQVHQLHIAKVVQGKPFMVYRCQWCGPHKVFHERPFHVGGCLPTDEGAVYVQDGVAMWWCDCRFSVRSGEQLWICDTHKGVETTSPD